MPDLDPATKETWAGLREQATRRSEIAEEVADLRAKLSGYPSYDTFVQARSDYADYESTLTARYTEVGEITDDDASRTRTDLEDNISSWSDYQTGVGNQSTWDAYRTYLTNQGLTSVEADRHIQLLQITFDPGQTFKDDSSSWSSFADFETYLSNNGFSSSEATNFRNKVEQRFADFAEFDMEILSDDTPLQRLLSWAEQLTEAGDPTADTALRLWDVSSLAIDGTSIPDGALTLRGADVLNEIAGAAGVDDEDQSAITYSNISASSTQITVGDTITVSADVTNNTSDDLSDFTVPLLVNSQVEDRKTGFLAASDTRTVPFDWTAPATGLYTLAIGTSGGVTVRVRL